MRHTARSYLLLFLPLLVLTACSQSASPTLQSTSSQTPTVTLLWKSNELDILTATPVPNQIPLPWLDTWHRPAVANNILYFTHSDLISPNLYAIDQQTGLVKWQYKDLMAGLDNITDPVLAGDLVIFGASELLEMAHPPDSTNKTQAYLYAIDTITGQQRWRYTANSTITTPTISGGTAYFGSSLPHSKGDPTSPIDGTLHAVNMATGAQEWTLTFDDAPIRESPTIEGGSLYLTTSPSNDKPPTLHALDLTTHQEKWHISLDKDRYPSAPLAKNGIIYILSNGKKLQIQERINYTYKSAGDTLHAIDAATGQPLWSYSMGPTLDDSPIYDSLYDLKPGIRTDPQWHNNKIIFAQNADLKSNNNGLGDHIELHILALDANTGTEAWRYTPGNEAHPGAIEVSATSRYILFGTNAYDTLRALDPATGQLLWQFPTGESPTGPVVEDGPNLYTVDDDGTLYALQVNP